MSELADGRSSTCWLHTIEEAAKYADCRTSYAELEERQRILIEIVTDKPRARWKFWKR